MKNRCGLVLESKLVNVMDDMEECRRGMDVISMRWGG